MPKHGLHVMQRPDLRPRCPEGVSQIMRPKPTSGQEGLAVEARWYLLLGSDLARLSLSLEPHEARLDR